MRKLLPLIFFILSLHCFADKYRMRVYFKDKQGYENIDITKFLSEKSIERRERQGIEIDYTDYPVNSSYLDELVKDGFKIVCQIF